MRDVVEERRSWAPNGAKLNVKSAKTTHGNSVGSGTRKERGGVVGKTKNPEKNPTETRHRRRYEEAMLKAAERVVGELPVGWGGVDKH